MNQRLVKTSVRSMLILAGLCIGTAAMAAPSSSMPAKAPAQPMDNTDMSNPNVTSDDDITQQVKSRLSSMSNLQDSNINVTTMKGEVTLTGTVSSKDEEKAAKGAAQSIPGVTKVKDDLSVSKSANGSSGGGH